MNANHVYFLVEEIEKISMLADFTAQLLAVHSSLVIVAGFLGGWAEFKHCAVMPFSHNLKVLHHLPIPEFHSHQLLQPATFYH